MAYADARTRLPLDRWARIIGIDPRHFAGIEVRPPAACATTWFQYEWQSPDRVSREEVARAIAQAEHDIEMTIGYRLLPTFEVNEWRQAADVPKPELIRTVPVDVRGFAQTVRAKWGYVITGGIRGKTLIDADAAITWSDEDGDTYTETGTVTVTVEEGQAPCEVRAYYPDVDGADKYEIRPITIEVVGTVATITFRREQAVLSALLERDALPAVNDTFWRPVNGADDANFLETIDVYRVFVDPSQQGTMLWEPFAGVCNCTSGCSACAYGEQSACLTIRDDPRLGYFGYTAAEWNIDNAAYDARALAICRQPDAVRLSYLAGWQDESLDCPRVQMDQSWERAVAYYAAALLDREICACSNVHEFIKRWRRDLAEYMSAGGKNLSASDLACPFGTREGALFAWKRCMQEGVRIGKAVAT